MSTLILVFNSGSSSLKYSLFDMAHEHPVVLAEGLVERIGEQSSDIVHSTRIGRAPDAPFEQIRTDAQLPDHAAALSAVADAFSITGSVESAGTLVAVGHRVVHGGDRFAAPAVIDAEVIDAIRDCIPLAPLHNPANLLGIEVAMREHPEVPHVAVFDTAFHQSMPPAAYLYAIDRRIARDQRIRRYGFHGTSHAYVSRAAARVLGKPLDQLNAITLHLGNGASAAAIRGGVSVDTSMGMTPLAGLVMGTRTGDVDPGVIFHLVRESGMSIDEVDALFNKSSGLNGLCGDNDLRVVHARAADGDEQAIVALDVYVHRLKQYVGAYIAVLGSVDAVVFTAGVGEHDTVIRERVCSGMSNLGVEIDPELNAAVVGPPHPVDVATESSPVRILVIPTAEEREIANQSLQAIRAVGFAR
ncbi:MAG: acetate kinase [Actinomycetes bacterium]